MKNLQKIKKLDVFLAKTNKDERYYDFLCKKIDKNINGIIAHEMLNFALSKKEHKNVYNQIIKKQFKNIAPTKNKTVNFVIGQSGAGKTSITKFILKQNNNFLKIDVDLYKTYNPLSKIIFDNLPFFYNYLTGIDSYMHKKEIENYAVLKNFNVITEISPNSIKKLENNLNFYKQNEYKIIVNIMCTSLINSLLSVHERYEKSLKNKKKIQKLTDIDRAVNSFVVMTDVLTLLNNYENIEINLFKRYKKGCKKVDFNNNLVEAYNQIILADKQKTLKNMQKRIDNIKQNMQKRKASKIEHDGFVKTLCYIDSLLN